MHNLCNAYNSQNIFLPAFYPGVIVALSTLDEPLKVSSSTSSNIPQHSTNPYAKYLAFDLTNQGINCNEVKRLLRINFSNRLLLWTHLLWITGSVVRDLYGYETLGPKREIPPEIQQKLDKYLSNNPTEYLSEMQEWLLDKHKIIKCLSNINQILWNVMNISLKKNHLVNSNQSDLKMEYLSQVGTMQPAENMVFAGESSLSG